MTTTNTIRFYIGAEDRIPSRVDPYWHFEHNDGERYDHRPLRFWMLSFSGIRVNEVKWKSGIEILVRKKTRGDFLYYHSPNNLVYKFNGSDSRDQKQYSDAEHWLPLGTNFRDMHFQPEEGKTLFAVNLSCMPSGDYKVEIRFPAAAGLQRREQEIPIARAPIYRYMYHGIEPTKDGNVKVPARLGLTEPPKWQLYAQALTKYILKNAIPDMIEGFTMKKGGTVQRASNFDVVSVVQSKKGLKDYATKGAKAGIVKGVEEYVQQVSRRSDEAFIDDEDMGQMEKKLRLEDVEARYSKQSPDRWRDIKDVSQWEFRAIFHPWLMSVYSTFNESTFEYESKQDDLIPFVAATLGILKGGSFVPLVTRWRVIPYFLYKRLAINSDRFSANDIAGQTLGANRDENPDVWHYGPIYPNLYHPWQMSFEDWLSPFIYKRLPIEGEVLIEHAHYPGRVPKHGTGLRFPVLDGLPKQPDDLGLF